MIPKTKEELAEAVASLIADNNVVSEDADFFATLEEKLRDKGFTINAYQQGIGRTYFKISKLGE